MKFKMGPSCLQNLKWVMSLEVKSSLHEPALLVWIAASRFLSPLIIDRVTKSSSFFFNLRENVLGKTLGVNGRSPREHFDIFTIQNLNFITIFRDFMWILYGRRESGRSGTNQIEKLWVRGRSPRKNSISIFQNEKLGFFKNFWKQWGFGGIAPGKFFWDLQKIYLREKKKIRGRGRESYSHNLGNIKWLTCRMDHISKI